MICLFWNAGIGKKHSVNMKYKISILKYFGRIKDGILVLLSIVFDNNYYEATFYYNKTDILLTISEDLEKNIGHKISEDDDYVNILKDILKQITPYSEIINKLETIL